MTNPRLAHRYAKSLLDLAQERGQLEPVFDDMLFLQKIMKSSRELIAVLRSPIIATDKKIKVLEAITAGKVSEPTSLFIKLLVNKGRENSLTEVINAFIKEYKQLKNIHSVTLTTAVP